MRPAGEIRIALLAALRAWPHADRWPTARELAAMSQVGFDAAMDTIKNLVRAGVLVKAGTRPVQNRNRPVAVYALA